MKVHCSLNRVIVFTLLLLVILAILHQTRTGFLPTITEDNNTRLHVTETPIFITVDGIPEKDDSAENRQRSQDYVRNLRLLFKDHPYVTILTSYTHVHIVGSLRMAVEFITTKFMYVVQHDFKFIKQINHTALVEAMHTYPKDLRIVRFSHPRNHPLSRHFPISHEFPFYGPECDTNFTTASGLTFHNGLWSDNNHITTPSYYQSLLNNMTTTMIPPEWHMMRNQETYSCTYYGQMVYGPIGDGPYLQHLDGRKSEVYRRWRE